MCEYNSGLKRREYVVNIVRERKGWYIWIAKMDELQEYKCKS